MKNQLDVPLLSVTACAFVAFVALADLHEVGAALAAVVLGYGFWRRNAVLKIDWLLLLIFIMMFVVLRSLTSLPAVHDQLAGLNLNAPLRVYLAGGVLSQVISNVPAAILLAQFTHDWHALAFGVSVGGFGLGIGSLANLIAVRLAGIRGIWGPFHLVSIPFFLAAGLIGAALIHFLA